MVSKTQKLVEWVLLRSSDSPEPFERYAAFLSANPDWPGALLRRRAEARLWQERHDGITVRHFINKEPTSSVGRLALARVLMNEGDRDGAAQEVRAVLQSAELSAEMESAVLDTFTEMLGRPDNIARMDRRLGAKDFGAAMRAAKRVGDDQVAVVKACIAAETKSAKGGALLDAVSTEARMDLGYVLCRLHWLMRNEVPAGNLHGRIVTPQRGYCRCGQAGARRVAGRFAAAGHRRMVARASRVGPQTYRPRRCSDRISGGTPVSTSGQSLLSRGIPLYVWLDRAALSCRSGYSCRAFYSHR
jgi:hypothetical protein